MIVGAIIGAISAAAPHAIEFLNRRQDRLHELEMTKLMIQREQIAHSGKMEEISANRSIEELRAEIQESIAIQKTSSQRTGIRFIDGWNGAVRPAMATVALAMFVTTEVMVLIEILPLFASGKLPIETMRSLVWSDMAQELMSAVIMHFLVGRQLMKIRK